VILCGYTGGYTGLGGGEKFLQKIRADVKYERLTPALQKKGPKFRRAENAVIADNDSGITGSSLLKRILERFRNSEYKRNASAIIVMDDTDCKFKDKQRKYEQAIKAFESDIKKINPDIQIFFFLADPEIEIWFYYDAANIFSNNIPLIKELKIFHAEYKKSGWKYDSSKDSCLKKYSKSFEDILKNHTISYSKKQDGSEYLAKTSPAVIANQDTEIGKAVAILRRLN
jgi:hypothetical protein